jgi:ATP-binding cassette subfamily B protein
VARILAGASTAQAKERALELLTYLGIERRQNAMTSELSGGEAQRIAIARALLADTPVLVLDEATAFADPQTEQAVRRALSSLEGERTVLVIAHRLETVADADMVVMLENGTIVERGGTAELLAAGGKVAAFWQSQRSQRSAVADGVDTHGGVRQGDELR